MTEEEYLRKQHEGMRNAYGPTAAEKYAEALQKEYEEIKNFNQVKELKMTDKFDPTKPCQTRDGRKVEIIKVLDTPLKDGECIIAVVNNKVRAYYSNGVFFKSECTSSCDLVNISVKRIVWANIYYNDKAYLYDTKKHADDCASLNRIACIKIEFEEGEGLDI